MFLLAAPIQIHYAGDYLMIHKVFPFMSMFSVACGPKGWRLFLCLLLAVLVLPLRAETVIRTLGQQSIQEASHAYYQDLLQLVLKQTEAEFGPAKVQELMPPRHGDMFYMLQKGDFIDLHRFGTDLELEKKLLPIRVPLLGGGLGWRGMMIRKIDHAAFLQLDNFSQLKHLTACQGMNWPDSTIMEQAGLKVLRIDGYDQMLQMLSKKRCDYFPRSVFEGPSEVAKFARDYPDLMFSTDILLKYPYAMYFFVKQNNELLAKRLQKGLTALAITGQLQAFMQKHPVSRHVFPLSQFENSLVFELQNPVLPPATPLSISEFWLQLPPSTRVERIKAPRVTTQAERQSR